MFEIKAYYEDKMFTKDFCRKSEVSLENLKTTVLDMVKNSGADYITFDSGRYEFTVHTATKECAVYACATHDNGGIIREECIDWKTLGVIIDIYKTLRDISGAEVVQEVKKCSYCNETDAYGDELDGFGFEADGRFDTDGQWLSQGVYLNEACDVHDVASIRRTGSCYVLVIMSWLNDGLIKYILAQYNDFYESYEEESCEEDE